LRQIRIGIPPWPSLRYFYMSFFKLIDLDMADLEVLKDSVLVSSKHTDVRKVINEAHKYALELLKDYIESTGRYEFPLSGNDKKGPLLKLFKRLGVKEDATFSEAIEAYADGLQEVEPSELQNSLYPFTGAGDLAVFATLNLDFYGFTRGPYFDGAYKLDMRLNHHQVMLCLAGYFAARTSVTRVGQKRLTTLIFPLNLNVSKYDFYRNLRQHLKDLPGLRPEEGAVLWMAIALPPDFPEDLFVVGVEDPGRTASVGLTLPMQLINFRTRASEFLERALENRTKDAIKVLLKKSFAKGIARGGQTEAHIDDAIRYVKLLYLAAQGLWREKLELLLRSSRVEALTSTSKDEIAKKRNSVAKIARYVAQKIITIE